MPNELISFHTEDLTFGLSDEQAAADWIVKSILSHDREAGEISFIFVSDERLREINQQYLQHDYYTDVITFDYTEGKLVSGDIFISVDRVRDNAGQFQETFLRELSRVMIHGVLHLMGFKDKTEEDERKMRGEEEKLLTLCLYL